MEWFKHSRRKEKKLLKRGEAAVGRITALEEVHLSADHRDHTTFRFFKSNPTYWTATFVIEEGAHQGSESRLDLEIRSGAKFREGMRVALRLDPDDPNSGAVDWDRTEELFLKGEAGLEFAEGVPEDLQSAIGAVMANPDGAGLKDIQAILGSAGRMRDQHLEMAEQAKNAAGLDDARIGEMVDQAREEMSKRPDSSATPDTGPEDIRVAHMRQLVEQGVITEEDLKWQLKAMGLD